MRIGLILAVLLAAAPGVRAVETITNAGTAHFQDDAAGSQPPVTATAVYTVKANPVVRIRKTVSPPSAVRGAQVEFFLTVRYSQTGTACGDDSVATSVFVYDTIPAGLTYVPLSASLSSDGGLTYSSLTATNFNPAGPAVTVPLGSLNECSDGASPGCGPGGCARVVKFRVTVN